MFHRTIFPLVISFVLLLASSLHAQITITAIDVGQGDAVLVQAPTNLYTSNPCAY